MTLTFPLPGSVTTRSSLPSPLKSPVARLIGPAAVGKVVPLNPTEGLDEVTLKRTPLDVPPPGPGLTTVTAAVLAAAISEARIFAVSCEPLTKVVVRALPFQFTTEPETKPVPFTVSVKATPPGAAVSGTSG